VSCQSCIEDISACLLEVVNLLGFYIGAYPDRYLPTHTKLSIRRTMTVGQQHRLKDHRHAL